MLIQITNRCRMGCPHCLDDSRPDGGMMTDRAFGKAVAFAKDNGERQVVISGGEPTEHPDFFALCKTASACGLAFSFASNGMWIGDKKKEWQMEKVAKLRGFAGGQIYSNSKWYRLHDVTLAKWERVKGRWEPLGIWLDLTDIRGMSDIGRAKGCVDARAEAERSPYHNICLTACVTAAGKLAHERVVALPVRRECLPRRCRYALGQDEGVSSLRRLHPLQAVSRGGHPENGHGAAASRHGKRKRGHFNEGGIVKWKTR